jgi:hypothetical protein
MKFLRYRLINTFITGTQDVSTDKFWAVAKICCRLGQLVTLLSGLVIFFHDLGVCGLEGMALKMLLSYRSRIRLLKMYAPCGCNTGC